LIFDKKKPDQIEQLSGHQALLRQRTGVGTPSSFHKNYVVFCSNYRFG